MRKVAIVALLGCLGLGVQTAHAELRARPLLEALARGDGPLARALGSAPDGALSFVVQGTPLGSGEALHVVDDYYVARGLPGDFSGWALSSSQTRAQWAAPLRMLLDEADGWTSAGSARNSTGLTGQGVYVGIIDSGVDSAHPDLRNADGTTRIAWLIDFARDPAGLHPEVEERYGCNSARFPCRVLSRADIDVLLANAVRGDEPLDRWGHGTHVASLAAGNGFSDDEPRYVGMAPGASLVVAQAEGPGGVIDEANVLLSTRFIFERAQDDDVPAVVNISLGTDFGAHDGSSAFEQALAGFVGAERPGRAIVVAAGNSAVQSEGLGSGYPEPLGVHTEVRVNQAEPTRVPLLTIARSEVTRADVLVWIRTLGGSDLSVRFDNGDGRRSERVEPGATLVSESETWSDRDEYEVLIVNSPSIPDDTTGVGVGSIGMLVSGSWRSGRTFGIVLEGQGHASLWVEANRDLTRTSASGAFFSRSSKQGTITLPATHPELIAVGATLNRDGWVDAEGIEIDAGELSRFSRIELGTVGAFSSAGPSAGGVFKPEIVAPGINVVGALSEDADPRDAPRSVFSSGGVCPSGTECLVVDDRHAVNTGTSMASPLVAGAIALLMEREPELTSERARHYLMAGSRKSPGGTSDEQQNGVGALDVEGALGIQDRVQGERAASGDPSSSQSRFVLGDSLARPTLRWPLTGWLLLRDTEGRVSDPDPARVRLWADPVREARLERAAPGLWKLSALAEPGSGGERLTLRVLLDGRTLAERALPIAVDRHAANPGFSARGGCQLSHDQPRTARFFWLVMLVALARRKIHPQSTAR